MAESSINSESSINKSESMDYHQPQEHRRNGQQEYNTGLKNKRVVILGSGFAGIEVLKRLQKEFRDDDRVEIILISKDNFLLFTPMLPEVSVGMIETRDIVTPVRIFCKRATFYQSFVKSIDFTRRKVTIANIIGNQYDYDDIHNHILYYDYLVIALGSVTNFFGNKDLEKYSFTMKSIDDALILRNHIINVLEQASLEVREHAKNGTIKKDLQTAETEYLYKSLLTFVVVGGGFSGIETVGTVNDFIRETTKVFYKNINDQDVRILLINGDDKVLDEVGDDLGKFAVQKLKERGVEFMLDTFVNKVSKNCLNLDNDKTIPSYTIVWTAGVTPGSLVKNLECKHDKDGRIVVNSYLQLDDHREVYAIGDCASITDLKFGKPYPPTAQHAIREGRIAAHNMITEINRELKKDHKYKIKRKPKAFTYKTRGMMAEIGKKTGVATVFGLKFKGFIAWWLWRTFYLAQVPTTRKRLKVILDWSLDTLYKPDVAMIQRMKRNHYPNLFDHGNLHKEEREEKQYEYTYEKEQ